MNPLVIGGYEAFMYLLAVTGIYTIAVNSQEDGTVWSTSNDEESQSSSTPITIGAEETNDIGKCHNKSKCPDDVYNKLTENVNRAKAYSASLRKCLETMTNAELQLRIDAANAERSARIERENTCRDGGNSRHQQ